MSPSSGTMRAIGDEAAARNDALRATLETRVRAHLARAAQDVCDALAREGVAVPHDAGARLGARIAAEFTLEDDHEARKSINDSHWGCIRYGHSLGRREG